MIWYNEIGWMIWYNEIGWLICNKQILSLSNTTVKTSSAY